MVIFLAFTLGAPGHMVEGYTHIYNCGWPQAGKRLFTDLMSYTLVNAAPTLTTCGPALLIMRNDARPYRSGSPMFRMCIQISAEQDVTRAATRTKAAPSPARSTERFSASRKAGTTSVRRAQLQQRVVDELDCTNTIGAVSQTGKFFAWSSDWLTTLGKNNDGHYRCDVFIVNSSPRRSHALSLSAGRRRQSGDSSPFLFW